MKGTAVKSQLEDYRKPKKEQTVTILAFPTPNSSQELSQRILQCQNGTLDHEYAQAKECIAKIEDPLWKCVCQDVMTMMGPVSLLKISNSILGEACAQNKSIDIYSPTEKTAQFIKEYSFVILGSLQTYFPTLKQLNVKTLLPQSTQNKVF